MAKIKGTGLGLFLVRNIARQHGGDTTATSPGHGLGTTITITLPLATSAEGTPRANLPETPSMSH
jgi:signal transduction histidine kinase